MTLGLTILGLLVRYLPLAIQVVRAGLASFDDSYSGKRYPGERRQSLGTGSRRRGNRDRQAGGVAKRQSGITMRFAVWSE